VQRGFGFQRFVTGDGTVVNPEDLPAIEKTNQKP
jgi:hypothetical protein